MPQQSKKQGIPASELLSFHFSTPAAPQASNGNHRQYYQNCHQQNKNSRRKKQQYHRTANDRASARKRADSAMFYLHSSPDHAFAITRRSASKVGGSSYSFSGCDQSVSWDAVRVVKHLVAINPRIDATEEANCPICLCDLVCPRITKCGHSFCLPCILHHMQSHAASNPNREVKCPCCSSPIAVKDLRPVIIQRTIQPRPQNFLQLRKLHRQKSCPAPYIPIPTEPRHLSSHAAPSQGDADACFSRFNYVDPVLMRSLLEGNKIEIRNEMKTTSTESTDYMFFALSMEFLSKEQQAINDEFEEELEMIQRFARESCGIYQRQSPALVYDAQVDKKKNETSESGICSSMSVASDPPLGGRVRGESIGSHKSTDSKSKDSVKSSGAHSKDRPSTRHAGTMYLDSTDAVHFYQCKDGQLVFLSGFNMACLMEDFSKTIPEGEAKYPPLPDYVNGRILEVQTIHLTLETRKRMPFLSHLPLYTDIMVVELDLSSLMSKETRSKFQTELAKRRKKRQSKAKAEKKCDYQAKVQEERLISERKARLQTIDPLDEFFQVPISPQASFASEIDPLLGSDFPILADSACQDAVALQTFSEACRHPADPLLLRSEQSFPGLQKKSEALPNMLGAAVDTRTANSSSDAKAAAQAKESPQQKLGPGKKSRGKHGEKLVLFSTGGQRNYNY